MAVFRALRGFFERLDGSRQKIACHAARQFPNPRQAYAMRCVRKPPSMALFLRAPRESRSPPVGNGRAILTTGGFEAGSVRTTAHR